MRGNTTMMIAPTAALTRLPRVLTGSAGAALEAMGSVRAIGNASGYLLDAVAGRTTSASRATQIFASLGSAAEAGVRRGVVNGATPGLPRALGSGQASFSASVHAALSELHSSRSILGQIGIDDARAAATGAFGRASANKLTATIEAAMPQLQSAARATAAQRVAIGAIGIGAAGAGAAELVRSREGDEIIAPGPFGVSPSTSGRVT